LRDIFLSFEKCYRDKGEGATLNYQGVTYM